MQQLKQKKRMGVHHERKSRQKQTMVQSHSRSKNKTGKTKKTNTIENGSFIPIYMDEKIIEATRKETPLVNILQEPKIAIKRSKFKEFICKIFGHKNYTKLSFIVGNSFKVCLRCGKSEADNDNNQQNTR